KNSEALCRLPVVDVNLGNALGKVVYQVVDRMIEGNFDQRGVGKKPAQLAPNRGVHTVVVVGVKKSPLLQIAAQRAKVLVAPVHVAVTGHIYVWNVPQVVVPEDDDLLLRPH